MHCIVLSFMLLIYDTEINRSNKITDIQKHIFFCFYMVFTDDGLLKFYDGTANEIVPDINYTFSVAIQVKSLNITCTCFM